MLIPVPQQSSLGFNIHMFLIPFNSYCGSISFNLASIGFVASRYF